MKNFVADQSVASQLLLCVAYFSSSDCVSVCDCVSISSCTISIQILGSARSFARSQEENAQQHCSSRDLSIESASPRRSPKKRDRDDELDEEPPEFVKPRGPRTSVSAEAYGDFNKMEAYEARVIEKTAEQRRGERSRL